MQLVDFDVGVGRHCRSLNSSVESGGGSSSSSVDGSSAAADDACTGAAIAAAGAAASAVTDGIGANAGQLFWCSRA